MIPTPFDETGPASIPILPKPDFPEPSTPGPLTLPPRPEIDDTGQLPG